MVGTLVASVIDVRVGLVTTARSGFAATAHCDEKARVRRSSW